MQVEETLLKKKQTINANNILSFNRVAVAPYSYIALTPYGQKI
uniref:Uncharacterized 4.8 kDa protein in secA 3'region n=1 Tax=Diacronema lutheri TaxID=2081491 RepID=YCX2_DIALT|nr:RecName: Full=Uncharacterized 4.8 kDa protein in secA 3'region [Diacronema lutheri]CAA46777.1 unnamed protein product [Diacronema lutheri]